MLRCGPAGAAGKSSGASELLRERLWYFHKLCSDLLKRIIVNTADHSGSFMFNSFGSEHQCRL